ncbi:F-box protein [Robbsia andropogonis]|uniref:F-box protein n=1 Tax=Robbsia andropogonis TaxID=28092 RepID=UPI0004652512|nr:F-box protein [Robbsia andropogonis]MCP1117812.1 F-box protein [Robbsia andropogonis]MCP1127277.1 F-box protein [Robbsia andropogonis]
MDIARNALSSLWQWVTYDTSRADEVRPDPEKNVHRSDVPNLPDELIINIASFLPKDDLLNITSTSQRFHTEVLLQRQSILMIQDFYARAAESYGDLGHRIPSLLADLKRGQNVAINAMRAVNVSAMRPSILRDLLVTVPVTVLETTVPGFFKKRADVTISVSEIQPSLIQKVLNTLFWSAPVVAAKRDDPVFYHPNSDKDTVAEFDADAVCNLITQQESMINVPPESLSDALSLMDLAVARWAVRQTFDDCRVSPCDLLKMTDKALWPAMLDSLLAVPIQVEYLQSEIGLFAKEYDGSGGRISDKVKIHVAGWFMDQGNYNSDQIQDAMLRRFHRGDHWWEK